MIIERILGSRFDGSAVVSMFAMTIDLFYPNVQSVVNVLQITRKCNL